jgi:hypothetical protein
VAVLRPKRENLGHYSAVITEWYAHLRPDLFTERDLAIVDVSLSLRGKYALGARTAKLASHA